MSFSQALQNYKTLIENLPSKPAVHLLSGEVDAKTIGKITLDGSRPTVLLRCGGGPMVMKNPLVCDVIFGAFVVGRADQDTKGMSRAAMELSVDICKALVNYRGDPRLNPNLPNVESVEEVLSGFNSEANNHSAWLIVWTHYLKFN
ncbi:hypothetical protein [Pseudomonas asplenii]|uniref:hypothetical protein n=1 Tax=Pseudomonas asplenii TaxID=53407 RepID=UPI0012FBD2E6|nr:hypothetical protein [Pseudomonas fuscovaginae]